MRYGDMCKAYLRIKVVFRAESRECNTLTDLTSSFENVVPGWIVSSQDDRHVLDGRGNTPYRMVWVRSTLVATW